MEEDTNNLPKKSKTRIYFSRLKRKVLKNTLLVRIALITLISLFIFGLFFLGAKLISGSRVSLALNFAKDLVFSPLSVLEGSSGNTNLLILGKGGKGHEAPDLTDTIVLVSVSHDGGGIKTISIPRDIWIPEIRAKINSAYYWGNQSQEGGGIVLSKSMVEKVTGQPVHYVVVLDFSIFKRVVDALGGIGVNVENGFVDKKYPIAGKENDLCDGDLEYSCRYETVEFASGNQFMDGDTALKFVRSRNSEGDEGTDIAREKRQQLVIRAIIKKALSFDSLLTPRLGKTLDEIFESVETDLTPEELAVLSRLFLRNKDSIKSYVLPEDLLINPPSLARYDYLYVFVPKDGTWNEIHDWVTGVVK